jgi:DNA polymerase-1
VIVGHKIMGFDLLAYAKEYGIDLVQLATEGRVFDTKLAGILNDPPTPGMNQKQIEREYSLDNMGARMLGSTKTGDLKALAKRFGGFDRIPLDSDARVRPVPDRGRRPDRPARRPAPDLRLRPA